MAPSVNSAIVLGPFHVVRDAPRFVQLLQRLRYSAGRGQQHLPAVRGSEAMGRVFHPRELACFQEDLRRMRVSQIFEVASDASGRFLPSRPAAVLSSLSACVARSRVAVCVARPSAFTQEKRLERALSSPPVWGAVSRNK